MPAMAEPRSRRDTTPRPRTRTREDDTPAANGAESYKNDGVADRQEEQRPLAVTRDRDEGGDAPAPRPRPRSVEDEEDFRGFDAEINNRYEEIKRGGTHISELQGMTIPQ